MRVVLEKVARPGAQKLNVFHGILVFVIGFIWIATVSVSVNAVDTNNASAIGVKPSSSKAPDVSADVPEPADYRLDDYRSPVPQTLKGARVIEAEDAIKLMSDGQAIFIDVYPRAPKPPNLPKNTVWRDPPHMSIKGAYWLPNVGYGVLSEQIAAYFTTQLERLTAGDKSKELVFFCLKDCWMSWNAAKRALEMGYSNVIWFSDGTDGWQEAGKNLARVKAVKD